MKKIILIVVITVMVMPLLNAQGMDAINFTAKDIAGNKVELFGYKNKVVVLDFWATWCGPCRRQIPHFIDLKKTFKNEPFEIISIALERGAAADEAAKRFVKDQNMNWTHIINRQVGEEIANKYGIRYIPSVFLIKNGKVLAFGLHGQSLKNKIKQLLKK